MQTAFNLFYSTSFWFNLELASYHLSTTVLVYNFYNFYSFNKEYYLVTMAFKSFLSVAFIGVMMLGFDYFILENILK